MGAKIELISFAFVSMEMLVCFRSGAARSLATLAGCVLVSISLSKGSSSVKMLPRYLNSFTCLS